MDVLISAAVDAGEIRCKLEMESWKRRGEGEEEGEGGEAERQRQRVEKAEKKSQGGEAGTEGGGKEQ